MPSDPTGKRIVIATPTRPGDTSGNSVTSLRWQQQLTALGHTAEVVRVDEEAAAGTEVPDDTDVIVVLHARRCAALVQRSRARHPQRPVVVVLTGTDLYRDLPHDSEALASLETADALVVLQEDGLSTLESIGSELLAKATVVHQSVHPAEQRRTPDPDRFLVVVLAHLRDVKDPLMTAQAARYLPESSKVSVEHAGAAHTPEWRDAAHMEASENHRYTWRGPLTRQEAAELMSQAQVLACTSKLEGGANVVSEAISIGLPVVGTRIGGNVGLLGSDHPGLVDVGDHRALASLLARLESDPEDLATLARRSRDRQWMTKPAHEQAQLKTLIDSL